MARLSTVRCPNCGANVRLEVGAQWVTCGYCKTEAYVQRPNAPPPPPSVAVVQAPRPGASTLSVVSAIGALALVGGLVTFAAWYEGASLQNVPLLSPAMPFDVNRDGAKDAIVSALVAGRTTTHVRALDARTGKGRFALALPERLETACEDENRFCLELADHSLYQVDPKSGQLSALPAPAERGSARACPPAVGFTWQAHGRFVRSASWEGAPDEEMDTDVALRFGREPTLLLAGERRKGSRVPMLAAARNGKVIWRTNLPTTNLLAAEEGDPSGSTLTAERAYATYSYADNSGFALVAIAMKDGAHLWETRVPRKSDPGSLTLSVDDNCIFVFSSGAMHCLSATGKLLWSVGWGLGH